MNNPLMDGLSISLSGIIVTFIALGIFVLVITLLKKIFPAEKDKMETTVTETAEMSHASDSTENEDELIPVVIAAAVCYCQFQAQNSLGASLSEGKGNWWASNRSGALQNTEIHIQRSGRE